MANTFRILRSVGNVAPTGLEQGELAYVEASGTGDGRLYIGAAGSTVEVVGGQYFIDLLNSYDTDLPTFAVPANTTITAFGKAFVGSADSAAATAQLDLATISVKGLMPVLSNVATQYLNGTGAFSTPAGGGDVSWNAGTAPADNALVRFDGVTGQLIQESQIIVDDTDNVTGMGTLSCDDITAGNVTGDVIRGNLNVAAANSNLTVNDTFFMGSNGSTAPMLQFDANDYIELGRSSDSFTWVIAGVARLTFTTSLAAFSVPLTATSFGGIASANLVDKSATETIAGVWDFSANSTALTQTLGDDTKRLATTAFVQAAVADGVAGGVQYKGAYNASTNTPDLDTTPIATAIGDMYTVTADGLFFTEQVRTGDVLIAEAVNATTLAEWTILERNLDNASETVAGIIEIATQAEVDSGASALLAVTPSYLHNTTFDAGTF